MKKFIILSAVTLLCSCSYLKGVLKNDKKESGTTTVVDTTAKPDVAVKSLIDTLKMKVNVTTLPLRAVGDSIKVSYKINFSEDGVAPNEKLIIIPVITFTDKQIVGDSLMLQGEALNEDNIIIVPKAGGVYRGNCSFPYNGSDPKNVKFHLIMQVVNYKITKFDAAEQDRKLDTIFMTEGLSLLDRLLITDEFIMLANVNALDSLSQLVRARQYAKGDSSRVKIDSMVSVMKTNYTNAVLENNFGVVAMQNGNNDLARQKFNNAIAMDSMLIEPRINLSLIDLEQGNYVAVKKNLTSGVLYNYVNGKYSPIVDQLTGCNRALVEILLKRLNIAEQILEGVKGNRSDMMKLVVYTHKGDMERVDSIIYKSSSTLENMKGYNVVKNEIDLYR